MSILEGEDNFRKRLEIPDILVPGNHSSKFGSDQSTADKRPWLFICIYQEMHKNIRLQKLDTKWRWKKSTYAYKVPNPDKICLPVDKRHLIIRKKLQLQKKTSTKNLIKGKAKGFVPIQIRRH